MRSVFIVLALIYPITQCYAQEYQIGKETIIFSSNLDGDYDIYVYNTKTGTNKKIIDRNSDEVGARWSPNGEYIIFTTNTSGVNQISLFSFKTGGVINLSNNKFNELDPIISPDGNSVVFSSNESGTYQLYVMDIDGEDRKKITSGGTFNGRPDWSPDSQKIVYLSNETGTFELFKININGTNKQQLTELKTGVGSPAWSKNGYYILFHAHIDNVDQIFSITANGKEVKQITNSEESVFSVRINSESNKISFIKAIDGFQKIHLGDINENLEITNVQLIDHSSKRINAADWANFSEKKNTPKFSPEIPDNYKIAFTSYRGGTADIHLMNPNGSYVKRITDSEDANSFAQDYGDGESIIYRKASSESGRVAEFIIRNVFTNEESRFESEWVVEGAKDINVSPNRNFISYGEDVRGYRELFVFDKKKEQHIKISDNELNENPASFYRTWWSPDSKKIAFISGLDYFNLYLYVYDLQKGAYEKLTTDGYMYAGLVWLKDSNSLIINIARRGKMSYELFHISAGEDFYFFNQLTNNPGRGNLHPSISPDGNWIAFESGREGDDGEIFLMRPDGSNQTRITYNPSYDGRPAWIQLITSKK